MEKIDKQIGRRIRTLRNGRQMTLGQLAELSYVSEKHLGKVERGEVNPSVHCLRQIALALNISVISILEADHEQSQEELVAEIITLAPELSLKDAQIVYRLIKMLTNR